ncbi:MAG: alanine--tRNA ligase-related protein [Patescibacteria group bacterium]|jgi:alanyl-tRNA synthetase
MKNDFYQLHLQFQNFMIAKGYAVREREKLVSSIFPTTFTMSGGPDLAYKFWRGDTSLQGNHIVNQPCIRHWDIDLTGDGKHLSFFNMFVADSIGGFTRTEVLGHFLEFFTKQLHLDASRIYATYFAGGEIKGIAFEPDNEVRDILLSLGFQADHIIPTLLSAPMECFVANTVEPVGGPRCEFFYDLQESRIALTPAEFWAAEQTGGVLEFFTHVLYSLEVSVTKTKTGESHFDLTPMSQSAIAAGFGPQRLMRIFEQVADIGDISILDNLKGQLGVVPPELHREAIIMCDHIRGLVFLVHDGVCELHGSKNRSRKYLFNKYIRNFNNSAERLSLRNSPVTIANLTDNAIDLFGVLFPEFEAKREYIKETLADKIASTR